MTKRLLHLFAPFLIVGVLLTTAIVNAAEEPEMTFQLSGVHSTAAAAFQSEMQRARVKVREWWGATFEGSISIQTDTKRVLSMALIPAWRGERGQMIFGAKRVNAGEAATVHEMIHVYAPNANRFLAEGLAVYGHDLLGGPPAYPNFGKSLDDIAGRSANRELAMALERTPTPNPLESVSPERSDCGLVRQVPDRAARHGQVSDALCTHATCFDAAQSRRTSTLAADLRPELRGDRGRLARYAAEKVVQKEKAHS